MSKFQQLKERGNALFQRKQYDQALEWYTKAIAEDGTVHAVYTNRAAAYFNLGKFQESLQDAEKSVELEPKWTKGYYRIGMVHLELGDPHKSIEAFTKGMDVEPGNAQVKEGLAQAQEAAKSAPKDHNDAKLKGNECYKLSQYEEAAKWYTKALAMAPPEDTAFRSTVFTNRAESYRQMALDDDAISDCTSALGLTPDNVKALIRRALSYERKEKLKQSHADFKSALDKDPSAKIASEGVLRLTKAMKQLEV
eukprot:CAMPEP_0118933648 /NCGR_PEP_ID=MMETSP1169-20130426/12108_1 /TAXON_ID=36882 /ORGANISM="Pyramimonas obovata, Strain CCMP722" /LENGTH=251 /DNA_ID=CAMNT_0006876439 /DNA_START=82 /DNA_END=834 /DNA_ORIENTATION=+